jgi:UDP-glucose 4,6-dehydratase
LQGNAVLPGIIREVCESLSIPWGHVSSGCIFTGSKEDGGGFQETDAPNFCFRTNNSSFYSGTKALGEECLEGGENVYIWRLRIPFNHIDSPRNYLSKLQRYENLLEARNSITHLNEFASVCYQCWTKQVPFGAYNVTNTGSITTREVVALIQDKLKINKRFQFFASEEEFMQKAAKTPRSNCVLDNSKLISSGVHIRSVKEAIIESLENWVTE